MNLLGRVSLGNTVMVIITVVVVTVMQLFILQQSFNLALSRTSEQVSVSLVRQLTERAAYTANYLSESLINPIFLYDMEGIFDLLEPALSSEDILEITVFDNAGNIFHTGQETVENYGEPLGKPALEQVVLVEKQNYSALDEQGLTYALPLYLGSELLGGLSITLSLHNVKQELSQTQALLTDIGEQSQDNSSAGAITVAVIMSLISIVISLLWARSLANPIIALVRQSQHIGQGEYHQANTIQRKDEVGKLATALNQMSASLQERTDKIEFLAYHDSLTRLPNREQFIRHVDGLLTSTPPGQQALAVIFIDLDEFKNINDNFGHQVGDQLLCKLATRLRQTIRPGDFLAETTGDIEGTVARIGGDEFLLCLPGVNQPEVVASIAERLLATLSLPISLDHADDHVVMQGSVGIALSPQAGTSAEELIKHADIAMYEAKADGKGTYSFFTDDMRQHVEHKVLIERELHKAQANLSQFELWYQPQFDLASGRLLGAEGLIRWRHPERGIIPPNDFIPIAEATGLIVPLGDWIIESACRQLAQWQSVLPEHFHISVNLSAKQLYRQSVVDTFKHFIQQYQLQPCQVRAEVTESLLMQNEHQAKAALDAIRQSAIEVWLDDFGTGFSSLSYLREYQFDGLKIDRSFVADIETDPNDRALCAAIVSMAKDLGIAVVAEGIENSAQQDFLRQKHCDVGQGYFYAKPLPADEFYQQFLSQTAPPVKSSCRAEAVN